METLAFATGNKYKFHTAQEVMKQAGITLVQEIVEVDEIQGEDEEIITRDKAQKIYDILGRPILVNDDSWSIPGLNGFPGPYMKSINQWFTPDDFIRLTKDLTDRRIFLRQVTVYQDERGQHVFTKEIPGTILEEAASGYPGVPCMMICSLTTDGRSLAEVRATTPEQLAHEHDTVWHEVAAWIKEYRT